MYIVVVLNIEYNINIILCMCEEIKKGIENIMKDKWFLKVKDF